ncbi:winged helix-turn-helix transcriptional regulator [Halobellus sp. Atlit-31R]|nr:winged helix-turn-helix transcriptional regulator [Halobellus sp. Atlit-31R]
MTDANLARHIDRQAARFIRAVEYYGGEATTTEIRQRTGLSRDVTNHRFKRLEDLGLIEISYADEGYGNRRPPKVAHLTGLARREIERGLLRMLRDDSDSTEGVLDVESEMREVRDRLDRHQRRLDALSASDPGGKDIHERLDSVQERLNDIEAYSDDWYDAAELYLRALRAALEDNGIDVGEYLREAQNEPDSSV